MSKQQNGFTLIELMIVVAIIGILATAAINIYANYGTRARVSEAMVFATSLKTLVLENAINGESDLSLGVSGPGIDGAPATNNVESITVDPTTGVVTVLTTAAAGGGEINFTPTKDAALTDGGSLLMAGITNDGKIFWDCTAGSLDARFRPTECRI